MWLGMNAKPWPPPGSPSQPPRSATGAAGGDGYGGLQAAVGLEIQVRVGDGGGEGLGGRVDDVYAVAGQRGPNPAQLGQAPLRRGRGVQDSGGASLRGQRIQCGIVHGRDHHGVPRDQGGQHRQETLTEGARLETW